MNNNDAAGGTDRRTFIAQGTGALAAFALWPDTAFAAPRVGARARKVGVIGIGRQGRDIVEQLVRIGAAVEVAAVCDVVATRVKAGQDRAAGAQGYADYRELLARADIDTVLIATPTHLHRQIVLDATAAKKHVYCEAPIAHTPEDARAIAA